MTDSLQASVDRWSADVSDAHAKLLYVLFDLALESKVDPEKVTSFANGCIEFARRGDPCHLGDIKDAAVLKFINCSWGQHQVVHEALARVFDAYVQLGVIQLSKRLDKITKSNWGNMHPLPQAILKGNMDTAERMVLHGAVVLERAGGEILDMGKYAMRVYGIHDSNNVARGPDGRARAAARLVAASMSRGIGLHLGGDGVSQGAGPGHDVCGLAETTPMSRRARVGL